METFETMLAQGHEEIIYGYDKKTGLKSIVAIHDTTLGPALGGVRLWPYENEKAALFDALRLSKGMTYKNAAAGLNLGGGKAVIIGDPFTKSEGLYRAFGRFVESLGGRYITAEDVNTTINEVMQIREETRYVVGLPESVGGSGDPSPFTALGTHQGIKISVKRRLGADTLKDVKVAVQGLGSVGSALCERLHQDGAQLYVTDINEDRVKRIASEFGATPLSPDAIYGVKADVFAPCALGAILNDNTIPQFKMAVIAGAANNQLLDEEKHGNLLRTKNILYAPDYIINAGGVINVYYEAIHQYVRESVTSKVKGIYDVLDKIFAIAETENISPHIAASRFAKQRLERINQEDRNVFEKKQAA